MSKIVLFAKLHCGNQLEAFCMLSASSCRLIYATNGVSPARAGVACILSSLNTSLRVAINMYSMAFLTEVDCSNWLLQYGEAEAQSQWLHQTASVERQCLQADSNHDWRWQETDGFCVSASKNWPGHCFCHDTNMVIQCYCLTLIMFLTAHRCCQSEVQPLDSVLVQWHYKAFCAMAGGPRRLCERASGWVHVLLHRRFLCQGRRPPQQENVGCVLHCLWTFWETRSDCMQLLHSARIRADTK